MEVALLDHYHGTLRKEIINFAKVSRFTFHGFMAERRGGDKPPNPLSFILWGTSIPFMA